MLTHENETEQNTNKSGDMVPLKWVNYTQNTHRFHRGLTPPLLPLGGPSGWLAVRGLVPWSRVGPCTVNLTLSCRQALSDQSGWVCPHLAPRTSLYPEVPYPTSSFPHSALWVCEGELDGAKCPDSYKLLGNNPLSPLLPNACGGVLHVLDAQYILIHWEVSFL